VDIFIDHALDLAGRAGIHVIVVAPPPEVFALADIKPPDPEAPLDAAKTKPPTTRATSTTSSRVAHWTSVPPARSSGRTRTAAAPPAGARGGTMSLQDPATRAWNFHTAPYYKAGGGPWRLLRRSGEFTTCYDDASKLLADGLASYRREHKTMPARVILHKTPYFDAAEIEGFRQAASDERIDSLDLVSVRRAGVRIFRAEQHAVKRGTALQFSHGPGVVYLKGTVSYFRTYPGPYVPRGLEFSREEGETPPRWISPASCSSSRSSTSTTRSSTAAIRSQLVLRAASATSSSTYRRDARCNRGSATSPSARQTQGRGSVHRLHGKH
jgi:hypothetical protein